MYFIKNAAATTSKPEKYFIEKRLCRLARLILYKLPFSRI